MLAEQLLGDDEEGQEQAGNDGWSSDNGIVLAALGLAILDVACIVQAETEGTGVISGLVMSGLVMLGVLPILTGARLYMLKREEEQAIKPDNQPVSPCNMGRVVCVVQAALFGAYALAAKLSDKTIKFSDFAGENTRRAVALGVMATMHIAAAVGSYVLQRVTSQYQALVLPAAGINVPDEEYDAAVNAPPVAGGV